MADGDLDDCGKRQNLPSYLDRPIRKLSPLLTTDEVAKEHTLSQEIGDVPIEKPTRDM